MSRRSYQRRRKRRQVPIPLASMGDIAFLIIIFFMLLSEAAKDKNLDLDLPQYAQAEQSKIKYAAHVAIDREGQIYMDGDPMQGAKDIEFALKAVLADASSDDQRHVQFKCHSTLTQKQFEPVIEAIIEAGGILEAVADNPPDAR